MKNLMVAAMASALACVAQAATFVVDANNSSLANPYELGATGADTKNANANVFDLRAGAVLKWVPTPTVASASANQWCSIVATNGAATILFGDGLTSNAMSYNFIARGKGSVTLRSSSLASVRFGHVDGDGSPSTNIAQYDFSNLSFAEDDGTPRAGTITMTANATMTTLQTQANVTMAFQAGKTLALAGENMFPGQNEVVFGTAGIPVNIYVLNPKAFSKNQTVNLASQWRTMFVKPCNVPDFATVNSRTWTSTYATNEFNVTMGAENAEIRNMSWCSTWLKGKVSGVGLIRSCKPSSDAPGSRLTLMGDCSEFTGTVLVESAASLTLNTPSLVGKVTLNGGNTELAFVSPAEGGASVVSIANMQVDGSAVGNRRIYAAANQTVKLLNYSGYPCLAGENASATIDLPCYPTGGTTIPSDGVVTITVNGQPLTDYVSTACGSAIFTKSESGYCTIDASGSKLLDTGTPPTYVAHGDAGKVVGVPAGAQLTLADGASATVVAGSGNVIGNALEEGEVIVTGAGFDWAKKVVAWFDPNVYDDSYRYPATEGGTDYNTVSENGESCPVVLGLPNLVRPSTVRMWNGRYCSLGYYQSLPQCYPYVASSKSPKAGLKYLSFGSYSNARRLQFVNWTSDVTFKNAYGHYTTLSDAKFAVLVFGSHQGGGYSILSTGTSQYFKRSGTTKDDPMMMVDANVWVNGAAVDPTVTGFSGGWDVISIDLTGANAVGALGADDNYQNYGGGKYYGEMLFFSEVLTDDQRVQVEEYVAKRWGLDGKYEGQRSAALAEARLGGRGTVRLAEGEKVAFSGSFAGTIDLQSGSSATILNEKTAYTEAEIGELGPRLWFDPEAKDALVSLGGNKPLEYWKVFQHDLDKRKDDDLILTSTGGGRTPALNETAFGLGPVRKWIDYNGAYETSSSQGNTMRLRTVGNPAGGTDQTVDVCTGFIVQNSVRGGGTPFLDNVAGNKQIRSRQTSNYADPIYVSTTTANLRDGKVYLNDALVDYTKGFTGGPEVFTFETKAGTTVPVGNFAWYNNSENGARNGEIEGEILLFGKTLTDEERSKVDAYLMKKWLGYMPAGYADLTTATLTGSGALTVPSLADAPKLSVDFEGELKVSQTEGDTLSLSFVRDESGADHVEGAINAPHATLDLPAEVTVNVSATVRPRRVSSYTLIDAADLGDTEFTLAGSILDFYPDATLRKTDGRLELLVPSKGMVLMLR